VDSLIRALGENIRSVGTDKWICRCPVHNDKDFAMSIKRNHDNSVMAHCFACGANGLGLYRALDLDLSEMFGDNDSKSFIPEQIKSTYLEDKIVAAMHKAARERGDYISLQDNKRNRLAVARMAGIEAKYPEVAL
jgi:hypothetical protein